MIIKIFFWGTKREQGNLLYGKPFTVELVGNPIKSTVNVERKERGIM